MVDEFLPRGGHGRGFIEGALDFFYHRYIPKSLRQTKEMEFIHF